MSRTQMTRGMKEHRRKSCESKRRYPDQATALAFAIYGVQRGAPGLKTYPCQFCGGYHLAKAKDRRAT